MPNLPLKLHQSSYSDISSQLFLTFSYDFLSESQVYLFEFDQVLC